MAAVSEKWQVDAGCGEQYRAVVRIEGSACVCGVYDMAGGYLGHDMPCPKAYIAGRKRENRNMGSQRRDIQHTPSNAACTLRFNVGWPLAPWPPAPATAVLPEAGPEAPVGGFVRPIAWGWVVMWTRLNGDEATRESVQKEKPSVLILRHRQDRA